MTATLHIGTSGWSFQDWKGPFYPADLPKGDMLSYYTQYFNCSELNSTYYNIPNTKVFESLAKKVPEDFRFTVKFNRETTHKNNKPLDAVKSLEEVIQPLKDAGKFAGYLGQFPYSFRNRGSNRRLLHQIRETLPDDPIFVEFRHKSWLKDPVYDYLRKNKLGYVCVDEPQLEGLLPPQTVATTDTGYIRLHGRNSETWWNSDVGDRYDYSYNSGELEEWVERIQQMQSKVSRIYIYFNNCHHGQAPLNAQTMLGFFE